MQTIRSFRSFDRPVQVAVANMLANNVGFYMLVPFLAGYMANGLDLALWIVGLVLGIRTLSQQGMSLFGGALADRFGYKQAIVAGSVFRTVAFFLFGFADEPIGMAIGAIMTGIGGALMSPAVRAYLAHAAGSRRAEAYALLDVTMHGGSLLGPIIGSLLIGIDFRLVCFGAAAMFVLVTFLQLQYLPPSEAEIASAGASMLGSWGEPLRNRPFVLFSFSILGYFFLYNQVYLGLPLEVERLTGSTASVGLLFTMLAVVGIFGQVPVTTVARARMRAPVAIALGLLAMGLAFAPLLASASTFPITSASLHAWLSSLGIDGPALVIEMVAPIVNLTPIACCCLLLIGGQMLVSPLIADTVASLSKGRFIGTYFGISAVVQGIGAALGNLAGGAAFDLGRVSGFPGLPWLLMVAVGLACAASVLILDRSGTLAVRSAQTPPAEARRMQAVSAQQRAQSA